MITFLLLLIGIVLIVFNFKAIKNEKNNFKDTFNDVSNNLKDYDFEIGKLRREFAETLLELQEEIENLKYNKNNIEEKQVEVLKLKDDNINTMVLKNKEEAVDEKKPNAQNDVEINNIKVNDIKEMIGEGLSIDSISEKLGMGKGEILLIKKLYLK